MFLPATLRMRAFPTQVNHADGGAANPCPDKALQGWNAAACRVVQRLTQPPAAGELDGGDGGLCGTLIASRRVASRPCPRGERRAAPSCATRQRTGPARRESRDLVSSSQSGRDGEPVPGGRQRHRILRQAGSRGSILPIVPCWRKPQGDRSLSRTTGLYPVAAQRRPGGPSLTACDACENGSARNNGETGPHLAGTPSLPETGEQGV